MYQRITGSVCGFKGIELDPDRLCLHVVFQGAHKVLDILFDLHSSGYSFQWPLDSAYADFDLYSRSESEDDDLHATCRLYLRSFFRSKGMDTAQSEVIRWIPLKVLRKDKDLWMQLCLKLVDKPSYRCSHRTEAPDFSFEEPIGLIDWNKVAEIDLRSIVSGEDMHELQACFRFCAHGDILSENSDQAIAEGHYKAFRICQFLLQYVGHYHERMRLRMASYRQQQQALLDIRSADENKNCALKARWLDLKKKKEDLANIASGLQAQVQDIQIKEEQQNPKKNLEISQAHIMKGQQDDTYTLRVIADECRNRIGQRRFNRMLLRWIQNYRFQRTRVTSAAKTIQCAVTRYMRGLWRSRAMQETALMSYEDQSIQNCYQVQEHLSATCKNATDEGEAKLVLHLLDDREASKAKDVQTLIAAYRNIRKVLLKKLELAISIKSLFIKWDSNNDNELDRAEFRTGVRDHFGIKIRRHIARALIAFLRSRSNAKSVYPLRLTLRQFTNGFKLPNTKHTKQSKLTAYKCHES